MALETPSRSLRVLEPPKSATKEELSELRVANVGGRSVPLNAVLTHPRKQTRVLPCSPPSWRLLPGADL